MQFLKTVVKPDGQVMPHIQNIVIESLAPVAAESLQYFNDAAMFRHLENLMRSADDEILENRRGEPSDELLCHIELVELLALATEGMNGETERMCQSLLPLDAVVKVGYFELQA